MKTDSLKQFLALRASLEAERAQLEARVREIDAALGASLAVVSPAAAPEAGTTKRRLSAAGKARIIAGIKARWARLRTAKGKAPKVARRKPKLSAAGRAAIIAAQKARWAKIKAAKAAAR